MQIVSRWSAACSPQQGFLFTIRPLLGSLRFWAQALRKSVAIPTAEIESVLQQKIDIDWLWLIKIQAFHGFPCLSMAFQCTRYIPTPMLAVLEAHEKNWMFHCYGECSVAWCRMYCRVPAQRFLSRRDTNWIRASRAQQEHQQFNCSLSFFVQKTLFAHTYEAVPAAKHLSILHPVEYPTTLCLLSVWILLRSWIRLDCLSI